MEDAVSGDERRSRSGIVTHPWLPRNRAHREGLHWTRGSSSKVLCSDGDFISSALPSIEEMGSTVEGRVRCSMLGKSARSRTSNDFKAVYHDKIFLAITMRQELTCMGDGWLIRAIYWPAFSPTAWQRGKERPMFSHGVLHAPVGIGEAFRGEKSGDSNPSIPTFRHSRTGESRQARQGLAGAPQTSRGSGSGERAIWGRVDLCCQAHPTISAKSQPANRSFGGALAAPGMI